MSSHSHDTAYWQARLQGMLEKELHIAPGSLAYDRNLSEYGLDSIVALTLVGDLEDDLGITLEPTLMWDYPSVNALAGYLANLGLAPAGQALA